MFLMRHFNIGVFLPFAVYRKMETLEEICTDLDPLFVDIFANLENTMNWNGFGSV